MQQIFNLFQSRFFATLVILTLLSACGGSDTKTETSTPIPADITAPVVTLNGDNSITLYQGEAYNELGATAVDDRDGNVEVAISGSVDTSTVGGYTVTYTATDSASNTSSLTRAVEVILPPDITAPVVTLNGENSITLYQGEAYNELGATAVDDRDGTVDVVISGSVDTSTVGSYTVTYTAIDNANNSNSITRTVDVIPVLEPVISKIDVFSEPTEGGQLLRAYPRCDNCVLESYQYNWSIDGVVVSNVASYSLTYSDFNKKIQIEIQGSNKVNVTTSAYQIIEAQQTSHLSRIYSNGSAFAVLKNDDTVEAWGISERGGDSLSVQDELNNVAEIYSNEYAFAALKHNGTVVTWGSSSNGGDSSLVQDELNNVAEIYSNASAFAALKHDGTVVTWNIKNHSTYSPPDTDKLNNVIEIYSTEQAFAALKSDGTVVTWGENSHGGDSSSVTDKLINVNEIYSNGSAYAALKNDGTVVSWGNSDNGGDSSAVEHKLTDILNIRTFSMGFIASKSDGTVVTWGDLPRFKKSVNKIVTISQWGLTANAGLNDDGTVVTWGDGQIGGDSSTVQSQLTNVTNISAFGLGFVALKGDGTIVLWGELLNYDIALPNFTDITEIYPGSNIIALKNDGTVEVWGGFGNDVEPDGLNNVTKIYENGNAFAALKSDGTVVTWGGGNSGGDSSAVKHKLTNVTKIFTTNSMFAALRHDGSIITWGNLRIAYNEYLTVAKEIQPNSIGFNLVKKPHSPSIVLNGRPIQHVLINNPYIELGANVIDDRDETIDVVIFGEVDTNTLGSYTVTYTATDSDNNVNTITRIVNVIATDNTAPNIELEGDSTVTVFLNETYVELGAKAIDDIDGDIEVIITGIVDTAILGRYNVTYSATDKANNSNSVTRTIDVIHRAPQINSLDITQSKTEQGYLLQAITTCTTCTMGNHQYTWTIDGIIVANTDNYLLTNNDFNKELHVKVAVSNDSGLTDIAYQLVVINSPRLVDNIYATNDAFAALRNDGTVVTWGSVNDGGDSSAVQDKLTDVNEIYSNNSAFAALKSDGSVVTWGNSARGGDSSAVTNELINVTKIFSNNYAFAVLKSDGTVVTWGDNNRGGDSSNVTNELTDVTTIDSTESAFAALKNDGTVVTWGDSERGGDSSDVTNELTDVTTIYSTENAFAALKNDGTVVTWGLSNYGGDSSEAQDELTDIIKIFPFSASFSAIKSNGSVVAWGRGSRGEELFNFSDLTNVFKMYSSENVWNSSFAALKSDGTLETKGVSESSSYSNRNTYNFSLQNITEVYSNPWSFAAIKNDGSVVTWGYSNYRVYGASSEFTAGLTNVDKIYSNNDAFAALKNDGSVYLWKWDRYGGSRVAVPDELIDVVQIYSNNDGFVALRNDGSVYAWVTSYSSSFEDDFSEVADELSPHIPLGIIPNAPVVVLNGESEITLMLGEGYSELGASIFDDLDDDINVVISGAVDTSVPGTYIVTYIVTDSDNNTSTVTRKVTVLPIDNVAPAITLNGASSIELFTNNTYTELGASAYDDRDGAIDVVISGVVDTTTPGIYTVTYTATDSANNTSSITRKVDIVEPYPPIINDITIVTELTESGHQLTAYIDCTECLLDSHQYTWTIDGELVSTEQNYLLTPDNYHKKSQVEVVVIGDENLTNTTYKTYIPNSVQVVDIYSIPEGFAALKSDGSVVSWASCQSVVPDVGTIKGIHLYDGTITVLTTIGDVVTWDCIDHGAEVNRDLTNVAELVFNGNAFAALKDDGTVVSWGHSTRGGDSSSVADNLTNVIEVFYSSRAFAALKSDGSVVTWGDSEYGGDSSFVTYNLSNVTEIVSNDYAFAALKADGTVVTWGSNTRGGDSSSISTNLTNVVKIHSLKAGFSVLKSDGSATIWGDEYLAHSGTIDLTNVVEIYTNQYSYAALRSDGSVITFGEGYHSDDITDVVKIYPRAFIMHAIINDGSLIRFNKHLDYDLLRGHSLLDGSNYDDPLLVSTMIYIRNLNKSDNPIVVDLTASSTFLVTLYSDGMLTMRAYFHHDDIFDKDATNVAKIYSNGEAFAALKNDGTVITLGSSSSDDNWGDDSSAVADELLPTITLTDVPNAPLLRFNGDKEITLALNDTYTELGVTAKDDIDDTVQVIVSGTVDTTTIGVYSITYTATDSDSNEASITRTINVVSP